MKRVWQNYSRADSTTDMRYTPTAYEIPFIFSHISPEEVREIRGLKKKEEHFIRYKGMRTVVINIS